jgi:hypothetical protein
MEDFEVRQALAVIKDRVNEIKREPDWKEKMADEWNAAAADDAKSQATQSKLLYKSNFLIESNASRASNMSYTKRMAEAKE